MKLINRLFNLVGDTQSTDAQESLFKFIDAPLHPAPSPDVGVAAKSDNLGPAENHAAKWFVSFLLTLLGLGAQTLVHESLAPLAVGILYLSAGILVVRLFTRKTDSLFALVLTFGCCSVVAAAAQAYSQAWFSMVTSTIDANFFWKLMRSPADADLAELRKVVNAPLAVVIWQAMFAICGKIGFSGLWSGVHFNGLLVGFCAAITQAVARLAVGNASPLLRYAPWFSALCGMHLLFGSILLRDSYAMLLNTIALYGIARFLVSPRPVTYLVALVLSALAATVMWYIREKSIYLFALFFLLATGIYLVGDRLTPGRIAIAGLILVVLAIAYSQFASVTTEAVAASDQKAEAYAELSEGTSKRGSLGLALIVKQPVPIKAVAGSLYMFVQPIPLWNFFNTDSVEYLWIKGYQGLFAVVIFPSLILGSLLFLRRDPNNSDRLSLRRFLVAHFVLTTLLVSMTSMESRHHGQFYPAYLILALVGWIPPLTKRAWLSTLRWGWFLMIVLGHITWAILR